ncbi:hypothetical protein GGD67_003853 [Bradyrhizobium sp. IAR9]|uniref:hypothetical protein n=1 Tax=Bradyrhizobium sp. IAR9 TaxID=2663841 RepID=UPI0015CD4AD7|nr:hypothetical protein [Bradyrhizobium sp. IAR9]NYG46382.1 hypothetical protein [Bradyrhizobium sp. IAR9]
MAEIFSGPVIGIEWQRDPVEPGFAVYTRHNDSADFKPAQYVDSFPDATTAERAAMTLGEACSVPVTRVD